MKEYGPLSPVSDGPKVLTATAIAIAVILLGSSFTVISAQQQQMTPGTGEIESTAGTAATPFQNTNDSFSIQVPNGWIVDDRNNTGFELTEELRHGYGLLAQLCPEQEQGTEAPSPNTASAANNATINNSCQGAQEEVIHIIRYPDLNIRTQPVSNLTQFHLQKLQEVGYGNMQITNTTDVTVNLTNPLTNETIQTAPATFADVTYTIATSPNEMRTGHYILTSTNNTAPNATATKGYAVFYESNSGGINNTSGAAAITPTTSVSSPLSPQVAQILDSFELIVTPEAAETLAQQAAEPDEFTEDAADDEVEEEEDEGDDGGDGAEDEDDGGDGDGGDGDGGDGDGGDGDGGDGDGGDGDGGDGDGGDGDGGDGDGGNPDDCIIVGGGNPDDDCDFTSDDDGVNLEDCITVGGANPFDDCDFTSDDDGE